MSKALEMIKLAREGNASRFGDMLVAGIQERVAAAVAEKRASLYSEGKNPFAKKDDDDKSGDDDGDDKSDKKDKEDGDDDKEDDRKSVNEGLKLSDAEREKLAGETADSMSVAEKVETIMDSRKSGRLGTFKDLGDGSSEVKLASGQTFQLSSKTGHWVANTTIKGKMKVGQGRNIYDAVAAITKG